MKKRFNPIKDKSAIIIEYLMSSPDIPQDDPALEFRLRLCIEEAVENVVNYAYEGGIGWMEAEIINEEGQHPTLTVVLKDAGTPFNPLDKDDPDINASVEDRKVGGLGIFICKQMMDNISYKYEDGCNVLTMQKYLE